MSVESPVNRMCSAMECLRIRLYYYNVIMYTAQDTVSGPATGVGTASCLTTGVELPVRDTSMKTMVCMRTTIQPLTTMTWLAVSTIRRRSAEVDISAGVEIRLSQWSPPKLRRRFRIIRSGRRRLRLHFHTYTRGGLVTIQTIF